MLLGVHYFIGGILIVIDYVADEYPLRLRGSSVPGEGRLEVYYNGIWGTLCDNDWGDTEAGVSSDLIVLNDDVCIGIVVVTVQLKGSIVNTHKLWLSNKSPAR